MKKIKLLYLVPHLSTGGMPQFVLKRIESLQKFKDQIEIFLIEYSQFSTIYLVQRNKILELLDDNHFFSLGGFTEVEKKHKLIDILNENEIDIVHVEEIPEGFESFNKIPLNLLNQLYDNNRSWKIIESCHNVWYNPENKKLHPDAYSFVTPYHFETFKSEKSYKKLHTYPYENKIDPILKELNIFLTEHRVPLLKKLTEREKLEIDPTKTHILNVGLWTEGKNQKEGIEVARLLENSHPDLHFHFIGNQAENFEPYWKPIMENLPSNVTVWGERNDVDSFMIACDVMMFNSVWECNPLVIRESINYGMKIIARNLSHYMGMFDNYITPIETNDCLNISNQLLKLISSDKTYEIENQKDFGKDLLSFYDEVLKIEKYNNIPIENDYVIKQHFVVNPFFEILGQGDREFNIKLFDDKSLVYENNIKINSWVKLNREYYTKWKTEVRENNNLIYDNVLDLENKRVYISFGSKSLGDTLAWIPYCEEFRLKHNCKLIVSTFMNYLFKTQYPQIEFVEPGEVVPNIYAQYRLGWFYNEDGELNSNIHKTDIKTQPLQKTATDILGLDYKEIRPNLNLPNVEKKKKVGIGFHSTAQAKYWNNKSGWQEVVDYLNNLGYECMIYSKEGDGYMNNFYPKGVSVFKGGNLQEVINDLSTCEFFIGLGSGLSWLAWACKLPVVLISGFSEKWAETKLDTYRVINENVCHGCFNWDRLDAGDWNWCPLHKGTDRQFECSKQITSEMVIKEINKIPKIDEITIILAHPNTEKKVETLIKTLKSIKTKKLLSINFPINEKIRDLCDYVIYDDENPILLKEEFNKYGSQFYWEIFENGQKQIKYFDYEHGYAVYKLISNGLIESKKNKFSKCHIINYDYLISDEVLDQNYQYLKGKDAVFYKYKNKSYTQDSFSTGFFSGNINKLIEVFTHYKNKKDYYGHKSPFNILEIITYDIVKEKNLNYEEFFYEDLKKTCVLDSITDSHTIQESTQITSEMVIKEINKIMNKEEKSIEIDEVTFDWGKKSEWYVSQATQEIFEYNIYERLFEVEEGDVVVDLGASLGPFTYSILPKNPKQCFVVEPLSYHIDILNKNVGRENVKIIQGAISDKKNLEITWDNITETSPTFTFKEFLDDNNINKIDFLKCDCEGGEYDVFSKSNIEFLKTIPKIVTEFHLRDDENFHQCKFRWFRDNILNMFENFEVYSIDGVNIKWDLWNEHFIEYYNEVIIYIDNR